jgi:hypothetical protein
MNLVLDEMFLVYQQDLDTVTSRITTYFSGFVISSCY